MSIKITFDEELSKVDVAEIRDVLADMDTREGSPCDLGL